MARHSTDILTWARHGAEARWNELQTETAALLKQFPYLRTISSAAQRTVGKAAKGLADTVDPPRRRRRSRMTGAQRKAVSERMKKYWAARKTKK